MAPISGAGFLIVCQGFKICFVLMPLPVTYPWQNSGMGPLCGEAMAWDQAIRDDPSQRVMRARVNDIE